MLFSTLCCMPQFHALTFPCLMHFIGVPLTFEWPYVDRAVPIFVLFPSLGFFHNFSEVTPIEAMEPVKEPDSQEPQHPAVPGVAPISTSASPPPSLRQLLLKNLKYFDNSEHPQQEVPPHQRRQRLNKDGVNSCRHYQLKISSSQTWTTVSGLQQELQFSENFSLILISLA